MFDLKAWAELAAQRNPEIKGHRPWSEGWSLEEVKKKLLLNRATLFLELQSGGVVTQGDLPNGLSAKDVRNVFVLLHSGVLVLGVVAQMGEVANRQIPLLVKRAAQAAGLKEVSCLICNFSAKLAHSGFPHDHSTGRWVMRL
jgi:hypothetical protein